MARRVYFLVSVLILSWVFSGASPPEFEKYFVDRTMRIDYFHGGDAKDAFITLDRVYDQGIWAGSLKNLVDPFNLGRYAVKVYDAASGTLIFSRGFDSYFGEYKTTGPALRGIKRTYHESVLIPYPRNRIVFAVESRDKENNLRPVFSTEIDPADITINRESLTSGVRIFQILRSGDPHAKVDIAIVAEGYTAAEEKELLADLKRVSEIFFSQEPYRSRPGLFNIYGVFKPSAESGCDEPSHGSFKNTVVGASFDSLGSERYVLTEDNRSLRDIAAHVPYDALVIMVNHSRYGGGGIYNLFCTFTVDNQWTDYLLLHEFGHSFAGLADEYYTSSVAYNEFYPRGIEPLEPNITALLEPENLKWKEVITPGIEIPTPWEKEEFDRMDMAYQKIRQEINERIAAMKRAAAPRAEVEKAEQDSEKLSRDHAAKVDEFLRGSKFWEKIGAFEGAGYSAQGLYRPALDCLMFTKGAKPFCKVCEQAVLRVIQFYT
ncbi:MAG: peptidase M64, partial [Candidatus Aminicenantes bacterium]|nr:peptidase M64 [Candidatus Aminicenantes bacterium]